MSKEVASPIEPVFDALLQQIQQARAKVFQQANTALIDLYWLVGKTISQKVQSEAWGKGVVTELAHYIAQHAPDARGFSDKNLWRMKQFYETYRKDEKLATVWRELSWSHNRLKNSFRPNCTSGCNNCPTSIQPNRTTYE